jgi:hypothetical protein
MPEEQRRPHYLYADEFQEFTHGVDLPTILAEARKFRLFVTVATQQLDRLSVHTQQSIMANCDTTASFRVNFHDAEILTREFVSSLPPRELQTLSRYEMYLKTTQDGSPAGPYLLRTLPPSAKTGWETT